jgi:DNA-binding transcriptional ArsR family regulator
MERTYMLERAAAARASAAARGRQVGRPSVVDPKKLAYATHLRDVDGASMAEIVERTGLSRATLYRHLPPRPEAAPTAAGIAPEGDVPRGGVVLDLVRRGVHDEQGHRAMVSETGLGNSQ